MPSIIDASVKVTNFPNRFVSPFGDDPVVPLYSSVPIPIDVENCLPCVVCGNFETRNKVIQQQAERFKGYLPTELSGNEVIVEGDDVQQSYMTLAIQLSSTVNIYKLSRNFKLLAWRAYTEQTRDVIIIIVKIGVTLFFSLILGGIYNNVGYGQTGANNRIGLLFLTSVMYLQVLKVILNYFQ